MTAPADQTIRGVAVPRTDPEGHGIHLAWSGPDLLPLSLDGYEVRRRKVQGKEQGRRCAVLDQGRLAILHRIGFLPDELGAMLWRLGMWPGQLLPEAVPSLPSTSSIDPAAAGGGAETRFEGRLLSDPGTIRARRTEPDVPDVPAGFGDLHAAHLAPPSGGLADPRAVRLHGALVTSPPGTQAEIFTQELDEPSDRVYVTCQAQAACAVTLAGGKARGPVALPSGTTVTIEGQTIDTVVVYAVSPANLEICAEPPVDARRAEAEWEAAEVLATRLTLPLVEADPALGDSAGELAAARGRLLPSEALLDSEFDHIAEALRSAADREDLGRPCDRVMLSRTDPADPFLETLFSTRIAVLSLDPRWRRVLGLGFADTTADDGITYEYQVRGHVPAADVLDDVFDVHRIPSGTAVPAVVRIRGLRLAFPAPTAIVLDPPPALEALGGVSRRGIALAPVDVGLGWLAADLLEHLSCVIDLPAPTDTVVLEVAPGHDLLYAAGPGGFGSGDPVDLLPPGPRAELHFAAPVDRLRLAGRGTLYAVRIPAGEDGKRFLHRELGPVTMKAEPLPEAPYSLSVANLQTPPATITGPVGEQTVLPARPQPGFRLTWLPATESPPAVWPEDLAAGPPLQAVAYQIEHRRVYLVDPADAWDQLQAGDNLTFASWPPSPPPALAHGIDLDVVFPPHVPRDPGTPVIMGVSDIFGVVDPETGAVRPDPPLGSFHEYRIRAVDIVGRVSPGWTQSNRSRLEKHLAPPLPVGPQPPPLPAGDPPRLTGPVGARARVILPSDPQLGAADAALLGAHSSAVVLEWGWRDEERRLDPVTTEFRVYVQTRTPTEVPGVIAAVASAAGGWVLTYFTNRWLEADECAGQWISSGGSAFQILTHTGGFAPAVTVAANVTDPAAIPATGPSIFGRPLSAAHSRPASWSARVAVVPLGSPDTYRYVIYDAVQVDAVDRVGTIWVGVSAADGESYVPDELPAAVPNGGRPGNESSIAAVTVAARYRGRPEFSVPPPLGDPPEIVTDEPTGRQVAVRLDAPALLGGALPSGATVALDRCSADDILGITRLDAAGNVVLRRRDGTTQIVVFPNPGDEAAVVAALGSPHPERLPARYLLFLLGHFDRPDELLQRVGGHLSPADALTDTVDPRPGRWFYRVRLADAAGTVSAGGAILPAVVRVPSTAPPPAPRRVSVAADPSGVSLTVDVDPDPELAWVLLFAHVVGWNDGLPDPARIQLLRLPNRRDLYPTNGIRLRLADGTLLTPVAKAITDPDVTIRPDGALRLTVTAAPPAPTTGTGPPLLQYVAYGLSRDGFTSRPLGPYSTGLGS